MRIAMAQMTVSRNMEENFDAAYRYVQQAGGADLVFFPEVHHMPFLPQYRAGELPEKFGVKREAYLLDPDDAHIGTFAELAAKNRCIVSPNLYLRGEGGAFDTSILFDTDGQCLGSSRMVHVTSAPAFYELDYYTPSTDGFHVYDTSYGRIGIVICFDRHLPESIRACAAMGAQLILIPTANLKSEPMELFEWEIRVQAYQNNVFIAMCNRTGVEGDVEFAGESLVADSDGNLVVKADDRAGLVICDVDLAHCAGSRAARPYIDLRRPEWYW